MERTKVRGHPFMTSIFHASGRGIRLKWIHSDGGGVSSMWTSKQKIRAHHWHHPVFFSCKDVGVFEPEFRLWM